MAERAGWTVVQEYVETASGASEARPELARARKDATRRRYDVLVAWDASRLARSLRVILNVAHELESLGIGLHLHQEAIDTTTPSGRVLLQVRGLVAELERSIIVERTKAGLARARSQGKRLGRPPASDALDGRHPQPAQPGDGHGRHRPGAALRQGAEPEGMHRV